eukprot:7780806-Lingulodinium_polyedra.AAC.1
MAPPDRQMLPTSPETPRKVLDFESPASGRSRTPASARARDRAWIQEAAAHPVPGTAPPTPSNRSPMAGSAAMPSPAVSAATMSRSSNTPREGDVTPPQ